MGARHSSFNELLQSVENHPAFRENFLACSTNEERIMYTSIVLRSLSKSIPDYTNSLNKSARVASENLKIGNENLRNKNLDLAHKAYSMSIAAAPIGSKELAFAFYNRSTVVLKMGYIKESIDDIDRAIHSGFPQNRIYELRHRKAKLLLKLGKYEDAIFNMNLALTELNESSLFTFNPLDQINKIGEIKRDIEKCQQEMANPKDFSSIISFMDTRVNLSEAYMTNPTIKGGADCVMLVYNETHRRHLVATRDIGPGKKLVLADRFVSQQYVTHKSTHCAVCLLRNVTLIPCTKCSYAMFCDVCWESNKEFHLKFECGCLAQSVHFKMNQSASIIYKILAKAGFVESLQAYEFWKQSKFQDFRTYAFQRGHFEMNIWELLNLSTYSDMNTFIAVDYYDLFLKLCLSGFALLPVIGKFVEDPTKYLHLMYILSLFYLQQNTPVLEKKIDASFHSITSNKIGTVISTLPVSFLVQSCNANTEVISCNNQDLIFSISSIDKGEIITFNRCGKTFARCNKQFRQDYLQSMYRIQCKCQACIEDWPMFDKIPYNLPMYLKDENRLNFLLCIDALELILDMYNRNISTQEDIKKVAVYVGTVSKVGGHKCKSFIALQEKLIGYFFREFTHPSTQRNFPEHAKQRLNIDTIINEIISASGNFQKL